ncbi:MAG: hypothetical protein K2X97_05645 [Mycobacteriaceae bacterium]|nr:hypothetical protein [Mycobacteriaceae bacterium]
MAKVVQAARSAPRVVNPDPFRDGIPRMYGQGDDNQFPADGFTARHAVDPGLHSIARVLPPGIPPV